MPWHLDLVRDSEFGLYIMVEPSARWLCESNVIFHLMSSKVGQKSRSYTERFTLNCSGNCIGWSLYSEDGFIREEFGDIVVEATVTVTKVVGLPLLPLCDFTVPHPDFTDVALIVEGKPLHVNKAYLAHLLPFFHKMFFSEFAEKTKKEIPLPELEYEEFMELLHVIHRSRKPVAVHTVESLLRLADHFALQVVLRSCEEFLRGADSAEIPLAKKLLWSDQYRLRSLKILCLHSCKSVPEVKAIGQTEEFRAFSCKMKLETLERIFELC